MPDEPPLYKNLFSLKFETGSYFWNLWKNSVHLSKDKSKFRIFFGDKIKAVLPLQLQCKMPLFKLNKIVILIQ